jgi:phenylpyruvate tautomerase PptA (4-oxalocrotonate tautomerase family)
MTNQDAQQLERIVSEMSDEQKRSLIDRLTESLQTNGNGSDPSSMTDEEWIERWERWAASHPPVDHFVDDSRESIYSGRGE